MLAKASKFLWLNETMNIYNIDGLVQMYCNKLILYNKIQ